MTISPARPRAVEPVVPRRRRTLARRPSWEAVAYLLLALAIAVPVVVVGWGRPSVDTSPRLYFDPWHTLTGAFSAWDPALALGQQDYDVGIAPVAAAVWLIKLVAGSVWLTTRLWRAILLLTAAAGAARLLHRTAPGDASPTGRVAAAAVYALNPYALVGGATDPILLPYAMLPWLVLALSASVRRPRSWRAAAAFAAAFFAMSGVNAGVVPFLMLLSVPCYLAYARWVGQARWRDLARALTRCGVLSVFVSLYWLLPSFQATDTGAISTSFTESPSVVAQTSSWAESLRGLGFWVTYGRLGSHPWLPDYVGYLTNAGMLVASTLIPLAAAAAAWRTRARLRALAVMLLAVGLVAMVGMFPPDHPTPFGRALHWSFLNLPAVIAFRTTNKAGPLAALGLALLVGLGAAAAGRWLGTRPVVVRGLAGAGAVAVLAIAAWPHWGSGAVPNRVKVPDYWKQASADLDASSLGSRLLMLPAQTNAVYRWGDMDGEDVSQSLFHRGTVNRTTFMPGASVSQANFMAALTVQLQRRWTPGTVAVMARYVGAGDVLLRNDMAWERFGGAHPSILTDRMQHEPGLVLAGSYGKPGQNAVRPPDNRFAEYGVSAQADQLDRLVPPLQRYLVEKPTAVLRAEPTEGTLLIDGDNFAVPSLTAAGLLGKQPSYRLLGATSADDLATALGEGGRVVLTDTNRRRIWSTSSTGAAFGPTLQASDAIPTDMASLSLFDADAQSVARLYGAKDVTSTGLYGSIFAPTPSSRAEYAFDGDPSTAWMTGPFGTAPGSSVTITFNHEQTLDRVTLRPQASQLKEVSSAAIHVGDRTIPVDMPANLTRQPSVTVQFPPTAATSVRVEITGERGAGFNPVGFAEIGIPGVRTEETVRLPRRFQQLVDQLDPTERALLGRAPLDVVLTREGDPATPLTDEEGTLDREFWLPDSRAYALTGQAVRTTDLPDRIVDQLVGTMPAGVAATSSSRWFGDLTSRASQAIDGNPVTAWSPSDRQPGSHLDLAFPSRTIDRVTVTQVRSDGGVTGDRAGAFAYATEADLSIDGRAPVTVRLGPGTNTIPVAPQEAHSLRLTVRATGGPGQQLRISELQPGSGAAGGGLVVPGSGILTKLTGCTRIATVDGKPLYGQLDGTLGRLNGLSGAAAHLSLTSCGKAPLRLGPGNHRLVSSPGWLLDGLRLSSPGTPRLMPPASLPTGRVYSTSQTGMTIHTTSDGGPFYLVLGQGYDPRWTAKLDGRPLGPPILIDGYSVGWRIDAKGAHTIAVTYGPQRAVVVGGLGSLGGLIVVLMLLVGRTSTVVTRPAAGRRPYGYLSRRNRGT